MGKELTVGELKRFLENVPPETEITFGSSRWRKRPLSFYRFKHWADDKLLIELSEIDQHSEPIAEMNLRKTAGYFLQNLEPWGDGCEVIFGASLDGVPLEFHGLSLLVGLNLYQTQEPRFRVEGD